MTFEKTPLNRVKRMPERGHYDKKTVYENLDRGAICHVGIVSDGKPVVIPVLYARMEDEIVLHGASASRLLKVIEAGEEVCITVTHVDGLVLARSVFHHSINYRSVVVFGRGRLIEDQEEKLKALVAISEQLLPGRWEDAREPTAKELNATRVVAVRIESASAKIRTGPPGDDEPDYELPVWAGVVPVAQVHGAPEPDPRLRAGIEIPAYLRRFVSGEGMD